MRKYLIFDTFNTPYHDNKVFNPEVARYYPGALTMCKFYEFARKERYEVMTSDLVDKLGIPPEETILITEQWSPYTAGLILRGALPGVVLSCETLWCAWSFYSKLRRISSIYKNVMVFEGARKYVNERHARFYRMYFPQPLKEVIASGSLPWSTRGFLTLIAGNNSPPNSISYKLGCLKEPALANDLYSERLGAIAYFSAKDDLHIYGRGWNVRQSWLDDKLWGAVTRNYKGECEDKIATLNKYRFSICFENTRFKGYVTEKIFDCFFAGCIPIYYGAPDIEEYIPESVFIDFRKFSSYEELGKFLRDMKPEEASAYLEAAKAFLASDRFKPFYQDNVARNLLDIVKSLDGIQPKWRLSKSSLINLLFVTYTQKRSDLIYNAWRFIRRTLRK